jgi:tetraacyldisaccharide 4'-kinase
MSETPSFWYPESGKRTLVAILLWPLTLIWRLLTILRWAATPTYRPKTPTIVIGNITAGGTGKTPFVAALAAKAMKAGRNPIILTRGYGGRIKGPYQVSVEDLAVRVGDEARWMSNFAPVVVARNRGAGAKWIDKHRENCDLIILDDGLQNPSIKPHRRVAVFNGKLGIGNGMLLPAGPLRESWSRLKCCDAIIITGDDQHDLKSKAVRYNLPVFKIKRHLHPDDIASVKKKPVIAFAGIGDPDGFFDMLTAAGVNLKAKHAFADHYAFTDDDIKALFEYATESGARLVTTEKDMVRIDPAIADDITAIRLETVVNASFMDILPKAK